MRTALFLKESSFRKLLCTNRSLLFPTNITKTFSNYLVVFSSNFSKNSFRFSNYSVFVTSKTATTTWTLLKYSFVICCEEEWVSQTDSWYVWVDLVNSFAPIVGRVSSLNAFLVNLDRMLDFPHLSPNMIAFIWISDIFWVENNTHWNYNRQSCHFKCLNVNDVIVVKENNTLVIWLKIMIQLYKSTHKTKKNN